MDLYFPLFFMFTISWRRSVGGICVLLLFLYRPLFFSCPCALLFVLQHGGVLVYELVITF